MSDPGSPSSSPDGDVLGLKHLLVVVVSQVDGSGGHRRLEVAANTWLKDVAHTFLSDAESQLTRSTRTAHVGTRGEGWVGHTPGDHKMLIAASVAAASISANGSTLRWAAVIDDDTTLNFPVLIKLLQTANWRAPIIAGSHLTRGSTQGCRRWNATCSLMVPLCAGGSLRAADVPKDCRVGAHRLSHSPMDGWPSGRGCTATCFCPVSPANAGRYKLDQVNGTARYSPASTIAYGGYGMLLSAGLLRGIGAIGFETCARRLVCGPGDFRVATCVRTMMHIGVGMMPSKARSSSRLLDGFLRQQCVRNAHNGTCTAANVAALTMHAPGTLAHRQARRRIVDAVRRTSRNLLYNWPWSWHRGSRHSVCVLWEAITGDGACASFIRRQEHQRLQMPYHQSGTSGYT